MHAVHGFMIHVNEKSGNTFTFDFVDQKIMQTNKMYQTHNHEKPSFWTIINNRLHTINMHGKTHATPFKNSFSFYKIAYHFSLIDNYFSLEITDDIVGKNIFIQTNLNLFIDQ